jgi:hypothetical protein
VTITLHETVPPHNVMRDGRMSRRHLSPAEGSTKQSAKRGARRTESEFPPTPQFRNVIMFIRFMQFPVC